MTSAFPAAAASTDSATDRVNPADACSSSRNPLIDVLKGLACAAIVWHHLAFYGPMSDSAQALAPGLVRWLYDDARMAVQVFLVLGGYLAAAQLAPQGLSRFAGVAQPAVRRFLRLAVPYAVALVLAVLAAALVRPWLPDHPSVPEPPTLAQLLANALMLQDIVGQDVLSAGVWYVAIDLKLFVLTLLLIAGVRALPSLTAHQSAAVLQALVVAATAASLWGFNRAAELDMWALYFFGAYGLGLMAHWAVQSERPALWWALLLVLGAVALALEMRPRIALAWAVALGLVWALRWKPASQGGLALRLRLPLLLQPLQALGRMAYSVFLLHFAALCGLHARQCTGTPALARPALAQCIGHAGCLCPVAAGGPRALPACRTPGASWTQALRRQAGLVGAGLLAVRAGSWL